MFTEFLHKLGFHKWEYQTAEFSINQRRECVICGKKERLTCHTAIKNGLFYWTED